MVTNVGTLNHYKNVFHIPEKILSCIPQGADTRSQDYYYKNIVRSNRVNLFYAGIFLKDVRDPRRIFTVLKQHRDSVRLKVSGSIDKLFMQGNEHIVFTGEISHAEVYEHYQDSDCVLFLDNSQVLQTSGKIYELLALRLPVLFIYTNPDSPLKKLCESFGHIIFVENDQLALDSTIRNLTDLVVGAQSWLKSHKGKIYDTEQFSWNSRAMEFKKLLCKEIDGR